MSQKTFKEMGIDAFPLCWPVGWKRTSHYEKKASKFKTSFAVARDQLFRELKLLGVRVANSWEPPRIILSSNVPLRRDGLPLAGQSNPKDPGIAVYFHLNDKPMVFACDQYSKVEDNLYSITLTIEALRGIKRWGASDMMERSFTGFAALPPPPPPRPKREWWVVLQFIGPHTTAERIQDQYRKLALQYHPDRGGDPKDMADLNAARDEGMKSI